MKRSRLLSAQFSMNDVLYNTRSTKKQQTSNASPEMKCSSLPVTPERDLFKGVSFKRLGSLETVDADELCFEGNEPVYHSEPQIQLDNPIQM